MRFNQNTNTNDNSQNIVNNNKKEILSRKIENFNYLYPNGHRTIHQMRWFEGSRNRGLKSDISK